MKTVYHFIFIALCLLTACKSQKPIVSENTSNHTLIAERFDSAHIVNGDSANASLLFRCDSLGNVLLAQLQTEQGKRINLELRIKGLQEQLERNQTNLDHNSPNLERSNTNPTYRNTPMLIEIDCKEDSFQTVIRGLRERIIILEEQKQKQEIPVKVIPDFYQNCTRAFWSLLVIVLIALALLAWKNWGKIAAWFIKMWAKFKLF